MAIKHGFESAIVDSADATEVQPSHWNADHTIEDNSIGDDHIEAHVTSKITVPGANVQNGHTDLANLTTGDPHTQYALLAGRAANRLLIPLTSPTYDLNNAVGATMAAALYINHGTLTPGANERIGSIMVEGTLAGAAAEAALNALGWDLIHTGTGSNQRVRGLFGECLLDTTSANAGLRGIQTVVRASAGAQGDMTALVAQVEPVSGLPQANCIQCTHNSNVDNIAIGVKIAQAGGTTGHWKYGLDCFGTETEQFDTAAIRLPTGSTDGRIMWSGGGYITSASASVIQVNGTAQFSEPVQTLTTNRFRHKNVMAKVKRTTDLVLATSTVTLVSWDDEDFDTDSTHDTGTNNTRLTAPISGKYLVGGVLRYEAHGTGTNRQISIMKNGVLVPGGFVNDPRPIGTNETEVTVTTLIDATSGQYFELQAFQDSGGDLDLNAAQSRFWFCYVGE